ncbi:MAG: methylglyoxal synthase [Spirochaetes bacterium]|jgi:methylglyoxal synthase|nr:methylglyoxal synthase [Spirochaetota bacterium]NLJ06009.1 methylglyoxal synthase [Exilispira sp.]MBP8991626.1 methylglyoxal synthase [Spirochaetota bacterium]HOV46198.1 methylglyoxal synthase [Exilispira sp.]HPO60159.1 methylglyoxal synthase [Exilispira sp.]
MYTDFGKDLDNVYRIKMDKQKRIALVAHDNKKRDLFEWVTFNKETLNKHIIYATGTTGRILEKELGHINKLLSGPIGGDQQIGSLISEGKIDILIFFWDPLEPLPHDPDIKALLRIAVVWNIPIACDRSTADFLISSPLFNDEYSRNIPDFDQYIKRKI